MCPAARCSRIRRTASGDSRFKMCGAIECVDETLQSGQVGAPVAAVDRAQEGAAVSLLGAQVGRQPPDHLADLGELLGRESSGSRAQRYCSITLVDMIVPSRSKMASAVEPAVSLYRSLIVVGRLPRLRRSASIRRTGRGDRWAVHVLDVGLPVEDGGVERERGLIIRMQRPGQREGVVVDEVQLRLRVLVVQRVIAPQEVQPDPGPIEVLGDLAGPVRARRLGEHPLGQLVRPLRGGQQPLDRGRAGELPLRQPGRPAGTALEAGAPEK